MDTSQTMMGDLTRRANDAFLAPFVTFPNIGLAAVNATVGGTARVAERAAQAMSQTGMAPFTDAAEAASKRIADYTLAAAQTSVDMATEAVQNAFGRGSGNETSNDLLAETVLSQAPATALLPARVSFDALVAAFTVPQVRDAAEDTWTLFSRLLDNLSAKGVLEGPVGTQTDAKVRFGFNYMATEGPIGAVLRDIRGIAGGVLALGFGDFDWFAEGARGYWGSMEYVVDKKLHGETQPESDFPIGQVLAQRASTTIKYFPDRFVAALETGDPMKVMRASVNDFGEVATLLANFPSVEFRVVYDVFKFVLVAFTDIADAQNYAICELGIMESTLSDAEKDSALELLRETAPKTTVEFEYYVPLLVPLGGTAADQALRRTAGGKPINHHTIAPSVFNQQAIHRAQAINSELFSLRSFLWLYGEEATARAKNTSETARKFGPEVAARLAANPPLYPTSAEQIAALTKNGPRPTAEINEIFVTLLHRRGLAWVSENVAAHLPG